MIKVDRREDCWTITLNRPEKMNALNAPMVEALIEAVEQGSASGTRALIFRGAGKNFSAGFDFGDLDQQSDADLLLRFVRIETLLHAVASCSCLTAAFAQGRNFGAGVDLFAACRLRYCTADATFRMPGLKFGLVLGTRRFADLVGHSQALDILHRSAVITAAHGTHIGLVTRLAEMDAWGEATDAVQQIADAFDGPTRQQFYSTLSQEMPDRDLATLVRSAARPGLKQRIAAYLGQR